MERNAHPESNTWTPNPTTVRLIGPQYKAKSIIGSRMCGYVIRCNLNSLSNMFIY